MILLITKYNLSPKWLQLFIFLIFYFILIKLHYINLTSEVAECMNRSPVTSSDTLNEATKKIWRTDTGGITSMQDSSNRNSTDFFVAYRRDPHYAMLTYTNKLLDGVKLSSSEAKPAIALRDYVRNAMTAEEQGFSGFKHYIDVPSVRSLTSEFDQAITSPASGTTTAHEGYGRLSSDEKPSRCCDCSGWFSGNSSSDTVQGNQENAFVKVQATKEGLI